MLVAVAQLCTVFFFIWPSKRRILSRGLLERTDPKAALVCTLWRLHFDILRSATSESFFASREKVENF
jgi:hypothetical protein